MGRTWLRVTIVCLAAGCSDGGRGDEGPLGDPDGALAGDRDGGDAAASTGLAPEGTVAGERPAAAANEIDVAAGTVQVLRVDTVPGEHTAFRLDFDAATAGTGVVMRVSRWNGAMPVELGETDAGEGLRVLAVLDQESPRTFWVHVEAGIGPLRGTLSVTRTPFSEGNQCTSDCATLLQLPLPNDERDGYDVSSAIHRYQFGRRDLLMFLRFAGRRMAAAGKASFQPADLSQGDGLTPGTDVGSLRHASHQRGKDVDISLYGEDGLATWRSFCTVTYTADGRVCVAGTRTSFDGYENARLFGAFLESGRVTVAFLDAELISAVVAGATAAATDGAVDETVLPLFSDGTHLQHWANQDNHIHVRVSEDPP